jgi:hypothetical protein
MTLETFLLQPEKEGMASSAESAQCDDSAVFCSARADPRLALLSDRPLLALEDRKETTWFAEKAETASAWGDGKPSRSF